MNYSDLQGHGHRRFHPRVFQTPGPVIDIGCLGWDWSAPFAKRKTVIGYDPQETCCPDWAELRQCAVMSSRGTMTWKKPRQNKPVAFGPFLWGSNECEVRTVSMSAVLHYKPSLIKINAEGSEYTLLHACPHPYADQLIVSFHDIATNPGLPELYIRWLNQWYDALEIDDKYQWWLFAQRS